jgi:hypothetical protein
MNTATQPQLTAEQRDALSRFDAAFAVVRRAIRKHAELERQIFLSEARMTTTTNPIPVIESPDAIQARLDRALELVPADWTPMLQIPAWSCDLLTLADRGLIQVRRQQGQFGRYHEFRRVA